MEIRTYLLQIAAVVSIAQGSSLTVILTMLKSLSSLLSPVVSARPCRPLGWPYPRRRCFSGREGVLLSSGVRVHGVGTDGRVRHTRPWSRRGGRLWAMEGNSKINRSQKALS